MVDPQDRRPVKAQKLRKAKTKTQKQPNPLTCHQSSDTSQNTPQQQVKDTFKLHSTNSAQNEVPGWIQDRRRAPLGHRLGLLHQCQPCPRSKHGEWCVSPESKQMYIDALLTRALFSLFPFVSPGGAAPTPTRNSAGIGVIAPVPFQMSGQVYRPGDAVPLQVSTVLNDVFDAAGNGVMVPVVVVAQIW